MKITELQDLEKIARNLAKRPTGQRTNMNTPTATNYGTPTMGFYLDQSYRNPDSHNAAVIRLAKGLGYSPDRETLNVLAREDSECLKDCDDSQLLSECADEAETWLNEQETRPFMYWANDGDVGAFGLWCNVDGAKEDCGFVSSETQDEPDADFRGEWLSVSDHGNATLYVREDHSPDAFAKDGYVDREIWSVV